MADKKSTPLEKLTGLFRKKTEKTGPLSPDERRDLGQKLLGLLWRQGLNEDKAIALIDRGADVEQKNDGKTALMWAAQMGHTRVVERLLDIWADIHVETADGYTARKLAKINGHKKIVHILELAHDDPDRPARVEAEKHRLNIAYIDYLATHGTDEIKEAPAIPTLRKKPMHEQPAETQIPDRTPIPDSGQNVEKTRKPAPPTPESLAKAAELLAEFNKAAPNLEKCKDLIDSGAYPCAQDNNGWSPLIWSSYLNQKDMVEKLLEKGADITAKTSGGWTALYWANERGDRVIVQTLISAHKKHQESICDTPQIIFTKKHFRSQPTS